MCKIEEIQVKVLDTLAAEAGVKSWNFGWVLNPTDPKPLWRWRFKSCRHQADRHHGGAVQVLREMRKENKICHDIYIRPSQSESPDSIVSYPYFMLDDVPVTVARQIAEQNRAAVVQTSEAGGCQVLIFTKESLNRMQRLKIQQHYQKVVGSDMGAVSGVQFSRMPGFKNYKRGGCWVNVLDWPKGEPLSIQKILEREEPKKKKKEILSAVLGVAMSRPPVCGSALNLALQEAILKHLKVVGNRSQADWRACFELLKSGVQVEELTYGLTLLSTRKGKQASKYSERTIRKLTGGK